MYVHVHKYVYVCTEVCLPLNVSMFVYVLLLARTYIRIFALTYVKTNASICTNIRIYVRVSISIYIKILTFNGAHVHKLRHESTQMAPTIWTKN